MSSYVNVPRQVMEKLTKDLLQPRSEKGYLTNTTSL